MAVAANPTPTSLLRLEKQTYDSNENSWGAPRLNTTLDLVDAAFSTITFAVEADVTLTVQNYTADQSRALALIMTGSGGFDVLHPASKNKPYLLVNNCTAAVDFGPDSQTLVTVRAGFKGWYYPAADGETGYIVDLPLNEIATATGDVALGSNKITGLADRSCQRNTCRLPNTTTRRLKQMRNTEIRDRSKCEAIIEAWRTCQSNYRAMAKVAYG